MLQLHRVQLVPGPDAFRQIFAGWAAACQSQRVSSPNCRTIKIVQVCKTLALANELLLGVARRFRPDWRSCWGHWRPGWGADCDHGQQQPPSVSTPRTVHDRSLTWAVCNVFAELHKEYAGCLNRRRMTGCDLC